jgi:hypothetical protein
MYGYYDFYNRNNDVFITLPRIFGDFCELKCGRRDEGFVDIDEIIRFLQSNIKE